MGLESHADMVLYLAGLDRGEHYKWKDGLIPITEETAKKIMGILDRTKEFGPTRYNKETSKIEFGVFLDFFSGNLAEYEQYRWNFKNWLVDSEGIPLKEGKGNGY